MPPLSLAPWILTPTSLPGQPVPVTDAIGCTVAYVFGTPRDGRLGAVANGHLIATAPQLRNATLRAAEALHRAGFILRSVPAFERDERAMLERLRKDLLEIAAQANGQGRSGPSSGLFLE